MSAPSRSENHINISLHCFPTPPNTPSLSGYCQKLETFFRLTSFANYTLVPSNLRSSPTGKFPYITIHHASAEPEVIADSHFIIRNLIHRGTIPDPDAGLSLEQKADSRALCVWVEQHIYPAVVHQRWSREHNVGIMIAMLPVPWFVKPFLGWYLRRNIVNNLWAAGIGRYSDAEVDEVVVEWLDALEAKFADGREWLMGIGVAPGIVDGTVWGFLINFVFVGEGNKEVFGWIKARKGVCAYIRRGGALWFPEYDIEKMLGAGDGAARVY